MAFTIKPGIQSPLEAPISATSHAPLSQVKLEDRPISVLRASGPLHILYPILLHLPVKFFQIPFHCAFDAAFLDTSTYTHRHDHSPLFASLLSLTTCNTTAVFFSSVYLTLSP